MAKKRILTDDDRAYLEECANCKVSYREKQALTDEQKKIARENIGVPEGGGMTEDEVQAAVEEALAQAKDSGEFDGASVEVASVSQTDEDGGENAITFTDGTEFVVRNGKTGHPGAAPTVSVSSVDGGVIVQIVSGKATTYFEIEHGKDYVLNEADKDEIARIAAAMVDVAGGVTLETDTTLTESGKAADAKAVGDALGGKLDKSGGMMTGKIVFPAGNANAGIANEADMKIFGYGAYNGKNYFRFGDTNYPIQMRGSGDNPLYNSKNILLAGDVYSKAEIDAALGSYITDIDALIGGDA